MSITARELDLFSEKLSRKTGGIGDAWVATLTRGLSSKIGYRESVQRSDLAGNGCSRTMPYYVVNQENGKKIITVTAAISFTGDGVGVGSTAFGSEDSGFTHLLKKLNDETDVNMLQFVVGITPNLSRPVTHGAGHAAGAAGSLFHAASSLIPSAINFGITRGVGDRLKRAAEQAKDARPIPIRMHYINLIIYKSTNPTTGDCALYFQLVDPTRNLIGVQKLTPLAVLLAEHPVLEQLQILTLERQNRALLQEIFSLPADAKFILPPAIATRYQSIIGDKRCGLFGVASVTHLADVFSRTEMPITPENIIQQIKFAHACLMPQKTSEQISHYITNIAAARTRGGVITLDAVGGSDILPEPAAEESLDCDDDSSLDGLAGSIMCMAAEDDGEDFIAILHRSRVAQNRSDVASAVAEPGASAVLSPVILLAPALVAGHAAGGDAVPDPGCSIDLTL